MTEEADKKVYLCPFRQTTCTKELCALYIEDSKRCALKQVALMLMDVAYLLNLKYNA